MRIKGDVMGSTGAALTTHKKTIKQLTDFAYESRGAFAHALKKGAKSSLLLVLLFTLKTHLKKVEIKKLKRSRYIAIVK